MTVYYAQIYDAMKKGLLLLLIIVGILFKSAPVYAALSLSEACQRAFDYDAKYRSVVADNAIYQEEVAKARSSFRPSLQFSAARGRSSTETTYPTGEIVDRDYSTENINLTVKQQLFNLSSFASYSQSKAVAAKGTALLKNEENQLVVRAVTAYVNVLLSQDNLDYSQAQEAAVKEQLDRAKRRYSAGYGTITEISEAQAQYDLVLAESLAFQSSYEIKKRELENIIGLYADSLKIFDPGKMEMVMPEPKDANEWVESALNNNYNIKAASEEIVVAKKEVQKSRAVRYPVLTVQAFKALSDSESNTSIGYKYDTYGVSLQASLPIYTGGYISSTVRQAKARLMKANEEHSVQERFVATEVRNYYNGVLSSIAETKAYAQAVKSSKVALTGTMKGYTAGFRSNVDVLNAQRNLFDNKRKLAKARYSYVVNLVSLKGVCGKLKQDDISVLDGWMK